MGKVTAANVAHAINSHRGAYAEILGCPHRSWEQKFDDLARAMQEAVRNLRDIKSTCVREAGGGQASLVDEIHREIERTLEVKTVLRSAVPRRGVPAPGHDELSAELLATFESVGLLIFSSPTDIAV